MNNWTFLTKRYEFVYWQVPYLAVVEVHHRPRRDWPLAAVADPGIKKTRQKLVIEAVMKATDNLVTDALTRLQVAAAGFTTAAGHP